MDKGVTMDNKKRFCLAPERYARKGVVRKGATVKGGAMLGLSLLLGTCLAGLYPVKAGADTVAEQTDHLVVQAKAKRSFDESLRKDNWRLIMQVTNTGREGVVSNRPLVASYVIHDLNGQVVARGPMIWVLGNRAVSQVPNHPERVQSFPAHSSVAVAYVDVSLNSRRDYIAKVVLKEDRGQDSTGQGSATDGDEEETSPLVRRIGVGTTLIKSRVFSIE